MITYPTDKLQKVIFYGKCEQNGTPTPDNPMDIVCNNGTIKVRNKSGLPLGYQKLEYLKATGTQLINTGISGNDDDLVIDIVCKYGAWVQYGAIFGNWISDGYNATRIITDTSDTDYFLFNYNNLSGGGSTLSPIAPKNTRLHIVLKKDSIMVNGVKGILNLSKGTENNNVIALFNRNVDNPANRDLQLEVESYSVSKNDVIIQNLVPCKRYDGVLGMYDTVVGNFLTNAGTGDFIAGAIDDEIEIYTNGTQEVVTDNLGNTANAERLLAIGDYKDTQSVIDGIVTRNVGIKVLDGTEEWGYDSTYSRFYTTIALNSIISGLIRSIPAYCTHFRMLSNKESINDITSGSGYVTRQDQNSSYVYFHSDITTTSNFVQFLTDQYNAGIPVIIVYPLATPTTEQVTPLPLAGSSATVTEGSIDNLPIETDIYANMKHRFITDANGKSRLVNKVYVGSDLIFKETEIVDMGLPSGTLWAARNIDVTQADGFAASPFQYNCSFFSWGNIDGHNPSSVSAFDYNWGGVNQAEPWYDGQVYGSTPGNTLTGNIAVGEDFDAARANLGAPWRMPTSGEFAELFANIRYINADGTEVDTTKTDKRVNVNGVMGLYLESRINGARLFFSCSGYGYGRSWYSRGFYGLYWSLTFESVRNAKNLRFNSSGVNPQNGHNRCSGCAVRAVI